MFVKSPPLRYLHPAAPPGQDGHGPGRFIKGASARSVGTRDDNSHLVKKSGHEIRGPPSSGGDAPL